MIKSFYAEYYATVKIVFNQLLVKLRCIHNTGCMYIIQHA